jgi:flagellar biosynthesis protein FliR
VDALIQTALTRLLFVGLRVSLVIFFLPFLGGGGISARIKAALTIALTALLYPVYAPPQANLATTNLAFLFCGEMIVGLAIGLSVTFVFEAVQVAGQICGLQLGYSLESLIDPQTKAQSPVLSIFGYTVAILIFLQLNVHHWMLRALSESFSLMPPGTFVVNRALPGELLHNSGMMLSVGVQMAAPITLAALMVDFALGFIGRAATQLPVMLFGISIKELMGMAMLAGTLVLWPMELERHFARAIKAGEHLLRLAH